LSNGLAAARSQAASNSDVGVSAAAAKQLKPITNAAVKPTNLMASS
jgi:hypothetical protein